MTAYARREIKGEWSIAEWEMQSVNQRYLEIYIHLPELFRNLEPIIRKSIRSRLTRGKVECTLSFEIDPNAQHSMKLNKKLAQKVIKAANWIKMQSNGTINSIDILRWPGVISNTKSDLGEINEKLIHTLEDVLDDFIASRKREGTELQIFIEQHLNNISAIIIKLRTLMPNILQWQKSRLLTKLDEVKLQLDNSRLEQELVLIAQRLDVIEELDRLEAHVKETHNILKQKGAVGRHLNFMMQEFNRESNTLAAKSINNDITTSAIELKVLIEQMREQIQNIE